MRATRLLQKAPLVGAFFVFSTWLWPALADNCTPPSEARPAKVRFVHDGDTLVLTDNTRVRLIGINTPEVARDDKPAEPLAIRARDRLRQLLFRHNHQVLMLAGEQKRDRHGRVLANMWLKDGTDISAELLRAGLGWLVAIPPNLRFVDCHRKAEDKARAAQLGVWAASAYKPKTSASLSLRTQGFQLVRGRIVSINHGGGATWIKLQGRFAIRIRDKNLPLFVQPPTQKWVGRELEVRGWVYQTRGELRVNIGHPANLELI
jgi:endonuclease YncB( thermonuclease family)